MKVLVFLDQMDYGVRFLGSKQKKIKENGNTSKKHMSIVFENKDIKIDFFSFLIQNMKIFFSFL